MGNDAAGLLTPPQVGSFDAYALGVFDSNDTWHGKKVVVRYKWTTRDGKPVYTKEGRT